eukprot:Rmarinus@m.3702
MIKKRKTARNKKLEKSAHTAIVEFGGEAAKVDKAIDTALIELCAAVEECTRFDASTIKRIEAIERECERLRSALQPSESRKQRVPGLVKTLKNAFKEHTAQLTTTMEKKLDEMLKQRKKNLREGKVLAELASVLKATMQDD